MRPRGGGKEALKAGLEASGRRAGGWGHGEFNGACEGKIFLCCITNTIVVFVFLMC